MKNYLIFVFSILLTLNSLKASEEISNSKVTNPDPQIVAKGYAPVGAVVPFFLSPVEVKRLAPIWLPLDGNIVDDKESPFDGQKLPNIQDRFILASNYSENVRVSDSSSVVGGAKTDTVSINQSFNTNSTSITNYTKGPSQTQPLLNNPDGRFLTDVIGSENAWGGHQHNVKVVESDTVNTVPPYRKFVYLIRVR